MGFSTDPVNTINLFDGPTQIFIGSVSTGTFIGATVGGVELNYNQEFGEAIADQTPLLLKSYLKQARGGLKFELEEMSLANMQLVFANSGLASNSYSNAASPATGGGNKSIQPTHTIILQGNGPNGTTRTFTIHNGRFHGNGTTKMKLGETVATNCEIIMEADQTQPDGQMYFTITDI